MRAVFLGWGTTKITNLGCSINRFSKGDASILIGPIEVKHGGGVTYQDSSISTPEPRPLPLPPLPPLLSLPLGEIAAAAATTTGAYSDWLTALSLSGTLRGGLRVEMLSVRAARVRCK